MLYNADYMLGMDRHEDVTPKRVVSRVKQTALQQSKIWLLLVCERLERLLCEPAGCFVLL